MVRRLLHQTLPDLLVLEHRLWCESIRFYFKSEELPSGVRLWYIHQESITRSQVEANTEIRAHAHSLPLLTLFAVLRYSLGRRCLLP